MPVSATRTCGAGRAGCSSALRTADALPRSCATGRPATYVCSRTLTETPDSGVTLVREDAAQFVRRLKQQPGKDICVMGGGDFARTLLDADLVDEVGFNVHPVLLGDGIPAFHRMSRQIDLELTGCREFSTGCVLLTDRVRHAAAAPARPKILIQSDR